MGLSVTRGRGFSEQLRGTGTDTSFLVNEALVRKMGWTEPLGRRVQLLEMSGHIVGVVRDFNFQSLHTRVEPLILYPFKDDFGAMPPQFRPLQERLLVLRIAGTDPARTLSFIKHVITQVDPQHPFEFRFLDSSLEQLYQSEQRLTALIGLFAAVCILIACLGLLGLAAFTTEQRTREIGTRKVLGATAWQIIALLSRETLLLVLVAGVLASVIAYLVVDQWLRSFAYKAPINPFVFALATAISAAVAFGTVALQAYLTARSDAPRRLSTCLVMAQPLHRVRARREG
jgi:putative ABC transport system permease protein